MKSYISIIFVIAILVSFKIGVFSGKSSINDSIHNLRNPSMPEEKKEIKDAVWTCSMHPHIKLPKPGQCPICTMDLIPLKISDSNNNEMRQYSMSESDKKLAEIETQVVVRKFIDAEISMSGKISYDETRIKIISSWVTGRLDRLFVDYTGMRVRKGDHLAMIYSPELLSAQEELIEASKRVKDQKNNDNNFLRQSNLRTLESVREKLKLWGISEQQISKIENEGKREKHLLLTAPIGGIVVQKNVYEGMYVKTGTQLFTIADLKHLWLLLDAYQSDLSWLRYGQKVEFETSGCPGVVFNGWVSYINPVLDAKTRTVKIRVNVENLDGKLKPEMFVSAVIYSKISALGKIMDPELKGKWICPMHPEISKDKKGICDICEMGLKLPSTLGYITPPENSSPPLVVPETAVLITGKRALVYVSLKGKDKPTYLGKVIQLGPRVGNHYIVLSGLKEGEEVVVNGNFKIDSALQIHAKKSMMSIDANKVKEEVEVTEDNVSNMAISKYFKNNLIMLIDGYLMISEELAKDNALASSKKANQLISLINAVEMSKLSNKEHMLWMPLVDDLTKSLKEMMPASNIEKQRNSYFKVSSIMIKIIQAFGNPNNTDVFQAYCPMALSGKGANWLQKQKEIRNPYFGASMLACGEVRKVFVKTQGNK